MRSWRALVALLLVGFSGVSVANAQTAPAPSGTTQPAPPPKKKKKRKPKKKRPVTTPTDPVDDDVEDDSPAPDYRGSPPKLDTDLKETDTATPSGPNPWASSGLVKKRGDETASASSSSAPSSARGSDDAARRDARFPPRGAISAEGLGGYASANLRIGFGLRVGYTLANNLYLGGAFTYHLGTRFGSTTVTFWYPAAEIGYDYRALPEVTLRPYAGVAVGVQHSADSSNVLVPATTNAYLTFYPGLQADYQLPHSPVYIGADIRLVLAAGSGSPDASFGFFVLAGARF